MANGNGSGYTLAHQAQMSKPIMPTQHHPKQNRNYTLHVNIPVKIHSQGCNRITHSGINTTNITILDQSNSNTTPTDIHTTTTTTQVQANTNALKNNFDAGAVQSELDIQVGVTKSFSETRQEVKAHINSYIDEANTILDNPYASLEQKQQAQETLHTMQEMGVFIDTLRGALYSPSDTLVGTLANTLSPKIVYEIGQHFKQERAEGSPEHLLAQTLVAAATASIAGNDALSAGLSAGGAEALSPILSQWLYDTDPQSLTSEQKNTLSNIITLGSLATGAITGSVTDAINSSVSGTVATEDNGVMLPFMMALAAQSYLNAPKDEDEIHTGTTGSEYLLSPLALANAGKLYEVSKTTGALVLRYDPSLTLTGTGVATGTSAYTNYDTYDGLEYVTHVATDGTISFLVGKYIPAGQNIASSLGYGTLGGGLSGFLGELGHQASDTYMFGNQATMNYQSIFFGSIIEGTAGATGKFYNNMGDMINGGHIINDVIDLGVSQSFSPVLEWYVGTPSDQAKQETE